MPNFFSDIFGMIRRKLTRTVPNRFVFTSFMGHYSDSPKYISERLHELSPDSEIVWLVSDKYKSLVPHYAKAVDINSKEAICYSNSARAWIDNVYGINKSYEPQSDSRFARLKRRIYVSLMRKRSQDFFTTWHGTPLKRMGGDQVGCVTYGFYCPDSHMILGNRFTLDIMDRLTYGAFDMQLLGCPRNDAMFMTEAERAAVKEKLGLPMDKKIVLFAPTFRQDSADIHNTNVMRSGVNQMNELDFSAFFDALKEKFGADFALVCRFHYHVAEAVDFDALEKKYNGLIINGNKHDDMAEYLACTDVLLTDASSCMFDFALSGKPCFIYFPDIDAYRDVERGFYRDPSELPFPVSQSADGLIDLIRGFDNDAYSRGVQQMLDSFGYVDDRDSSSRVAEYILKRCLKK